MADLQEVFRILKDFGTEAGEAPISRVEGEPGTPDIEGLIGFSFKDQSDNVVLPQLDSEGRIPVTCCGDGVPFYNFAEDATGNTSETDLAEITISVTNVYNNVWAHGCCNRPTNFRIYYVDDADGTPVNTEIGHFIVGSGQFSYNLELKNYELDTTGGTGTQKIKLTFENQQNASAVRGSISALQAA
jgi:hypothetical protein